MRNNFEKKRDITITHLKYGILKMLSTISTMLGGNRRSMMIKKQRAGEQYIDKNVTKAWKV